MSKKWLNATFSSFFHPVLAPMARSAPNAKNAKKSDAVKEVVKPQDGVALPENQTLGTLNLYKTDEKTAAVIMAIVSKESGVPLNRLKFNSIKLIENK